MSDVSTNKWWARALLWLHFVAVAGSIAAIWPTSFAEVGETVPLIALLCLIAICSTRVAGGGNMGRTGWVVQIVWTIAMVSSALQFWGPFCFQPQPMPGALVPSRGFGSNYELAIALRLVFLMLLYSGIPIGLAFLAHRRAGAGPWARFYYGRISSVVLLAVALLTTILLRLAWKGSEEAAGWIGGMLWASSFATAAYLAARGDGVSVRILLCAAGVLGLVRLV